MNEWRQGGPAEPLMPPKETGRKSGPGQWSWDGAVKTNSEVGGGICKSDSSHHPTRSTAATGRKTASPRRKENGVTGHSSLELMSKSHQTFDTVGSGLRRQKPFKRQ